MRLARTFSADYKIPSVSSPENQLKDLMLAKGVRLVPSSLIFDGEIHRFAPSSDKRNACAWYVIHDGNIPYGAFGDWSNPDVDTSFRADIGRNLTIEEERQFNELQAKCMADVKAKREQEMLMASVTAQKIWDSSSVAETHPYLETKKVMPHGVRLKDGRLVIPMYNKDGNIVSVQYINADGTKRFLKDGQTSEAFYFIEGKKNSQHVYLAEGFATAASIMEATGFSCFVAFSANNLPNVARVIPSILKKEVAVHIVADNDESGTGEKYANKCAELFPFVKVFLIPNVGMDANDYKNAGLDLKTFLLGSSKKAIVTLKEFLDDYHPTSWLIKGIIPRNPTLGMIFGRSGSGKSFFSIDLALTMASGLPSWYGHKAHQSNVLYLCAEGLTGMRKRIMAWMTDKQVSSSDIADHFRITQIPRDMSIDTPTGRATIIEALGDFKPAFIIVDTLNRFMSGDENKTAEATLFVQGMDMLSATFGCSVCVIHHTGQGKDSQDRERGSSVFRGAIDWQFFVEQDDNRNISFSSTKTKDGEPISPIYFGLRTIELPFIDEDGETEKSAVLTMLDSEPEEVETETEKEDRIALKRAILEIGKLSPSGVITLGKDDWFEFLKDCGMGNKEASNAVNPRQERRLAGRLIKSGWLTYEEGVFTWIHEGVYNDTIRLCMTLHRRNTCA